MIPRTPPTWHLKSRQLKPWQDELQDLIRDPAQLIERLQLDPALLPAARRAAEQFPLRVTESFLAKMQPGDPADPLLRQVLPLDAELAPSPGFTQDPLGERQANPVPGLIHKYAKRVLLIASGHCAIHCRYCFRRHFPYSDNNPSRDAWQAAFDYIRQDPSIDELILSGGDPLALGDKQLDWLLTQAEAIPHLSRLRIHSRLPVVLPSRLTQALCQRLAQSPLAKVLVIHANHPHELCDELAEGLAALRQSGVTLLNQSVLLRGVNDCPKVLADLSRRLFNLQVLPYYLHLLDAVQGAAHFAVTDTVAKELQEALQADLPGYLMPKFVREHAGALSKTPFV